MGILSGLFKSRDKPSNRINGSAYSFLMGGTPSGRRVNKRSAMQMTAVYSCVRILSEAVASLPLHVYERTEVGTAKAIEHPLYKVLHDEPKLKYSLHAKASKSRSVEASIQGNNNSISKKVTIKTSMSCILTMTDTVDCINDIRVNVSAGITYFSSGMILETYGITTAKNLLDIKYIYNFSCKYCGKSFSVYGNAHRKYCCHDCYIKDRFGDDSDE